MKRTGFKRKATVPMKRSSLRKVSKVTSAKLKKKLWVVFAKYIRKRDKDICFTCGKPGNQAGHFIPRSAGGLALYFHPDNVHCQCSWCNLHMQGNIWEYGQRLGEEKVKELYKIKNQTISKWTDKDYLEALIKYQTLYDSLN
jgi:hypothetical protein